ncbi:hypothetical protein XYCOK13_19480 [Xylanibacillus composti]|uniref:Uncharacterized protein n=1 Tax=Xylanibacillus composti TaxID=1572762 RepID=A0A8J4M1Y3_9BACL|nr:hypothetical protein XYCOK13_19480 [Xylanibacillus composti]
MYYKEIISMLAILSSLMTANVPVACNKSVYHRIEGTSQFDGGRAGRACFIAGISLASSWSAG